MAGTLHVAAPAKVNLHLSVGATRPDGYHDVITVLQALELHDTVTLSASRPFAVSCTPDIGVPAEQNLAYRAAHAMSERFGRALEVSITVEKRIPAAAGLGGASSDAAAVIYGLDALWGLRADGTVLAEVARGLGADVPFFLTGGAALYGGRGDVLVRRVPSLDCPIVIVRPAEPVSTAAAYAALDALGPSPTLPAEPLIEALTSGDVHRAGGLLHNDLTLASTQLVPSIADALELLATDTDMLGAAVAGSGSAVFGMCASPDAAARLAATARRAGFWAVATHAVDHGCRVVTV